MAAASPDNVRPVGRAAELEALAQAAADAQSGQPRVVLLDADAGMGKSTVLDAFLATLSHHTTDDETPSATVHRVVCDSYEQDVPFGLLELVVGERIAPDADPVTVARQLLGWLAQQQGDGHLVVLALDDIQWMDRQSVDALRFALRRLRADQVLAVLARRIPTGQDPWTGLTSIPHLAQTIQLGELTPEDVADLARSQRGWDLSYQAAQRVCERTAGHPLLVHAFLSSAAERDLRDSRSLPASVTDAVRRLLRHLGGDARQLIDALAVLDQPVGLAVLGTVAAIDDPASALAEAADSVAVTEESSTGRIAFSHELFRRAVYDALPADSRRTLHRRAIDWTTGERQLGHRVAAADRADPDLAKALVEAAATAVGEQKHAVAATHLLQARTVSADPAERDALVQRALLLRLDAGDIAGAGLLSADVELAEPSGLRSLALGALTRDQGDAATADVLISEAQQLAGSDTILVTEAAVALAGVRIRVNDGAGALEALGQAGPPPATRSALVLEALLVEGIALWQDGRAEEALKVLPQPGFTADSLTYSGMIRYYEGDVLGAKRDLDKAIGLLQGGVAPSEAYERAYVQRCLVNYALGDWDLAAVDASNARTFAIDADRTWTAPLAYAVSVLVPAGRGQLEQADQFLALGRAAYKRSPSPQAGGLLHMAAATRAQYSGAWQRVIELIEPVRYGPAMESLVRIGSFSWMMTALVSALVQVGRLDDAEAELEVYDGLLQGRRTATPARVSALRAELALARGDTASARAEYSEALAGDGLDTFPFHRARILAAAGHLERSVGNRRHALELLSEARRLLTELRATPDLVGVDADLAAMGSGLGSGGPLDLTPREQDVAVLVARGMTNGEVAGQLFLTAKTVGVPPGQHLRQARHQRPAAAARPDERGRSRLTLLPAPARDPIPATWGEPPRPPGPHD